MTERSFATGLLDQTVVGKESALLTAPAAEVSQFDLQMVLGRGAFGKVFLVKKNCGPDVGRSYAMKVITKKAVQRGDLLRTRQERDILAQIRHPFIVFLHYAFQTESKLYLVLDFMQAGDLFSLIHRERRLPEPFVRFYLAEVVLALGHLHSLGICYRDLKPENILLDAEGHIRVTDFGLCKRTMAMTLTEQGGDGARTYSFVGTVEYMAPEVVSRRGHSTAADFWSLGVLMYEMLTGDLPFKAEKRKELAKLEMPVGFTTEAQLLLRALFERCDAKRLGYGTKGANAVLAHPFFGSIDFARLYARQLTPPYQPSAELIHSIRTGHGGGSGGGLLDNNNITTGEPPHTFHRQMARRFFDREFTRLSPKDTPAEPPSTAFDPFQGFAFTASTTNQDVSGQPKPQQQHQQQQHTAAVLVKVQQTPPPATAPRAQKPKLLPPVPETTLRRAVLQPVQASALAARRVGAGGQKLAAAAAATVGFEHEQKKTTTTTATAMMMNAMTLRPLPPPASRLPPLLSSLRAV